MRLDFESNTASLPFAENGLSDDSAVISSQTKELLREGVKAAQAGNRVTARTLLTRVTEIEPKNENAWLWLASISEYPEELVVFLDNVLEINPENERALEWMAATKSLLAKTFVQRGIDATKENRLDFSKQCFEQALTQDANNEMAWLWLASIADSEVEKRSHLEKLLSINPANEAANTALKSLENQAAQKLLQSANQHAAAGERGKAGEVLAEVLEKSPELADAWLLKAHLTDSFEEKIKCFNRVLEINPEHQAARTALNSLQSLMEFTAPQMNFENAQTLPAPEMKAEVETETETAPEAAENFAEESFPGDENFAEEHFDDAAENQAAEMNFAGQSNEEVSAVEENQAAVEDFAAANNQTEEFSYDGGKETEVSHEAGSTAEMERQSPETEAQVETQAQAETENWSDDVTEEANLDDYEADFSAMSAEEFAASRETEVESEEELSQPAQTFENHDEPEAGLTAPQAEADQNEQAELQAEENPYQTVAYPELDDNYQAENAHETAPQPAEQTEASNSFEPFEETANAAEPDETFQAAETVSEMPVEEVKPPVEMSECPFCNTSNEAQAFACRECRAMLSLSDLEKLLDNEELDRLRLQQVVSRMEMDKNMRGFNAGELMNLGIAHLNLKNLRHGFTYLQDSLQMNPNNVLLASQVNALAIRLAEIERKEEVEDGKPKGKTILVIDDSATVRKLISGKLEKSGHEVVCAVDGMDALAKLSEIVPDLILLDITMPRMDGYQVCKLIRGNEATKNIPVVMISGKDGFFDKVRGRMAGTTGYITKPFGPETLMKALEMYIANDLESAAH